MNPGVLLDFVVALAIGGLIGLEREIYQQREKRNLAGIRTYVVIAFLGALSSFLMQQGQWPYIGYIVLAGIILLLVATHWASASNGSLGMTTELSAILVFVLAGVSMFDQYRIMAVIFAVFLTVLLSMKKLLHGFARNTKEIEWYDTLIFIFMTFVILPLLPNQEYAILGVQNAFNPYNTWMMVVLVSGISFVGYFLAKVIGGSYGIGITGVLGGLVSSTAVTESMSVDSKRSPRHINSYAFAVVAASIIMGIRVIVEVIAVDVKLLNFDAFAILVISIVGLIMSTRWIKFADVKESRSELQLKSPLSLKPALSFGIIYFLAVFFTRYIISLNLGNMSFFWIGLVSGIGCVDVATLSMANLFSNGVITSSAAWIAILTAVISNNLFKAILTRIFGGKSFFFKAGFVLLVMVVAGIIMLLPQLL